MFGMYLRRLLPENHFSRVLAQGRIETVPARGVIHAGITARSREIAERTSAHVTTEDAYQTMLVLKLPLGKAVAACRPVHREVGHPQSGGIYFVAEAVFTDAGGGHTFEISQVTIRPTTQPRMTSPTRRSPISRPLRVE